MAHELHEPLEALDSTLCPSVAFIAFETRVPATRIVVKPGNGRAIRPEEQSNG